MGLTTDMERNTEKQEFLLIGKIGRPFSFKGYVRVYPETDFPERLFETEFIHIKIDDNYKKYKVEKVKDHTKSILMKFEGIDSESEAQKLTNLYIEIPLEDAWPLEEDSYYIHDLIGMDIYDEKEQYFGKCTNVLQLTSNDVLVVDHEGAEVLLPIIDQVIKKVDLGSKRVDVKILKGLL